MSTAKINQTKYGVQNRLSTLESRCTGLEQENAQLRAHLVGALQTAINDAKNHIQSAQAADFRELSAAFDAAFSELKASVKNGVDGKDGQSIVGPKGEQGNVLLIGDSELAQAVLELRRKLKQQHATFLARIIEGIESGRTPTSSSVARLTAAHLEIVKRDIERLQ
jgi:hypothetical protein